MKLAYILGTFPSLTETFILREILELRRRGFELILFSLRRPAPGPLNVEAEILLPSVCYRPALLSPRVIAAQGYFLVRHPGRLLRAIGRTVTASGGDPVALVKCLRNLPIAAFFARRAAAFGAEHLHAHFAFMPADVARMMADLLGTGFSFSAHAADIYLQPASVLARKVRAARFVAVCTRYGRDELARKTGPSSLEKLRVIHHGVPPVQNARIDREVPLILAVGRLQPKKGFIVLMEACRLLRDRGLSFHCLVAGEGPERGTLEDAIRRFGLAERVSLLDACSQDQVAALFQQARVFALPCVIAPDDDRDSLPNAILEAMAAGVPVVTTPVAGIPEAIEQGRTGMLVPPGDARALASALEELLKSDPLCQRISVSGKAAVSERFSVVRNIDPLAELFEQMRDTP
jgi:colanic acid/amylovoran biosynthesis glycosyltransferase